MLIKKVLLPAVLIMCLAFSLIGCSATNQGDKDGDKPGQNQAGGQGDISAEEQDALMSEFNVLVESDADIVEIIKYVDDNIANLAPENASQMVIGLEKAHQNNLPKFETKFYSDDTIPQRFLDEYKPGMDINDVDAVKDQGLKELLTQTKEAGYKVDTAEGMFYPIIDYQQYLDYSSLVTPDIKAYIDIMAAESNNPPAKDAALVIGWDKLLTRALDQENFIKTYGDSAKLADVQELYERYVQFAIFGLNNTPLFSYDEKKFSSEAKTSYAKILAESEPSQLTEIIQGLLDTVDQNNGQLTDEVDNYRQNCLKELGIK